jgi:excisionase family DNA binding protein
MRHHHVPAQAELLDPVALTHTRKQASMRLNIGLSLLDQLIDAKEIHAIKLGKRVLVPEAELQRLIAERLAGAS